MKSKDSKRLFSALANQLRLRILDVLRQGEMSVTDIVRALRVEQSAVSHNLKPLIDVGLVSVRCEGQFRFYSLRATNVSPLFRHLERHQNMFERAAEEATRESRRRFDLLVRLAPIGIFVGRDGKVVFSNSVGAKILGFDNSRQAVGAEIHDFVPRDMWSNVDRYLTGLRQGRLMTIKGLRLKRFDGKEAIIDIEAAPFEKRDGTVIVVLRDVTEQHELENRTAESEAKYRRLFNEGPLGMMLVGPDGRFREVNRNFCRMLGYSAREVRGKHYSEITHPDHREADAKANRKLIGGERDVYKTEKRYITKRGRLIWVSLYTSIFRDAEGRPLFFQSQIEDITEEKDNRDRLMRTEDRCRQLIRRGPDGVCTVDGSGIIVSVQCRQPDRRSSIAVGRNVASLFPTGHRRAIWSAIAEVSRTGKQRVLPVKVGKDRKSVTFFLHLSKVERAAPSGEVGVCIITDKT